MDADQSARILTKVGCTSLSLGFLHTSKSLLPQEKRTQFELLLFRVGAAGGAGSFLLSAANILLRI